MDLLSLNQIAESVRNAEKKKLVVVAAEDEYVLDAVKRAVQDNIIEPVLVGDTDLIKKIAGEIHFDLTNVEMIHERKPSKSAQIAVKLVNTGSGDILMKGQIPTATMLKAVLDKENGLRSGDLLSHIAFFETKYYHKLISVTDAAMNINPDLNDKISIINNAVEAYHRLGVECPNVAVIGAVESVNPKMEPSVHGALLSKMAERKQITGCIVDGPMALDIAVSKEAAGHKSIKGVVAGNADILLTPDIYCGNVLYKSLNFLGGAVSAAVIMGASIPIVLTSRADTEISKYMSIALAAAMD